MEYMDAGYRNFRLFLHFKLVVLYELGCGVSGEDRLRRTPWTGLIANP